MKGETIFTVRDITSSDLYSLYQISCRVHMTEVYKKMIAPDYTHRFYKRYTLNDEYFRLRVKPNVTKFISNPRNRAELIQDNQGQIVGYGLLEGRDNSSILRSIFVDPKYSRRGVGTQLLENILGDVRHRVSLHVLEHNVTAIAFYKKHGFRSSKALSKTFYGASLIVMHKN